LDRVSLWRWNVSEALANGHLVHYELQGSAGAPVLVLSNSLGTTFSMWDDQIPALTRGFRVLRYDTRGHGGSEVTPGDYHVEQLGLDVLHLTDRLGIHEFSFCGLSLGGLIGQWLALNAGKRLRQVVLCNTAPIIGTPESWNARIATVRNDGLSDVVQGALARWFTPSFAAAQPARVAAIKRQLAACDPAAYAASCAAVRDADFRSRLAEIETPALIVAGASDPVTTLAEGEALASAIRGAKLAVMNAAHLSNIGDSENFNAALLSFLAHSGP
jgi:3-oxoadipate enol-lactonase